MQHNRIILSFLFLFGITYGQDLLTQEAVVQLTLKNNFDVLLSQQNEQLAEINTSILNSGFLPTLQANASGNYGIRDTKVALNNGDKLGLDNTNTVVYNVGTTLSYTLFNGFQRKYNYKQLKENYALSQLQTEQIIQTSVNASLQGFFQVAKLEQNLALLQESLAITKERIKRSEVGFEFGQVNKLDVLNAEVDYNNDSITLLNTKLQLDNAKQNLRTLMGVEPQYAFSLDTSVVLNKTLDIESLKETALANNASLKSAEQSLVVVQLQEKIAQSGFLPTVNVSGTYAFTNNNNDSNSGFNSPLATNYINNYGPSANLSLSWNLFDGGQTKVQQQNAILNERTQVLRIDQNKFLLESQIETAYNTYMNTLSILNAQRLNIETAEQNFERSNELYKAARIDAITLRQAQVNLVNAISSEINAKYDAKLAELNLMVLGGQILEMEF